MIKIKTPLLIYLLLDILFLCSGALSLAVYIVFRPGSSNPTFPIDTATSILLQQTPLTGLLLTSLLTLLTFLPSLPALLLPRNRLLLHLQSALLVICALLTLGLGLAIWFSTLKTQSNLALVWQQQSAQVREDLQRQFTCCGYFDPPSPSSPPSSSPAPDSTCPASTTPLPPCVGPFANFANNLLDVIFTAMFGMTALDGLLFLSAVVVVKGRAEAERFRVIDEKGGMGGI